MPRIITIFLLLLLSLLTAFRAPTWHLWLFSILVTEFSWVFILLLLGLLTFRFRSTHYQAFGIVAGAVALGLFIKPYVQAFKVSKEVKYGLDKHFGTAGELETPFSLSRIWNGFWFREEGFQVLTYDTLKELQLDFYSAAAEEMRPAVLVIHGGSWQSGDSRQLPELNSILRRDGFQVAALNYRKAPQHPFPAALEDVTQAIYFLKQNASRLKIDTNRLFLLGRSAGAQLALVAAYRFPGQFRGVVSFYGPADLAWGYTLPANPLVMDSRAVLEDYLGGQPEEVQEQYLQSSAPNLVGANAPATLMIHGLNDPLVAYEHNLRLIKKLNQFNRPYFLVTLPWATHGFDYSVFGPGGQISTYAVRHFLHQLSGN